jgi:hypothetical protein
MSTENEKSQEIRKMTAAEAEVALNSSHLDQAFDANSEIISAIEKQVDNLGSRLSVVSSQTPEGPIEGVGLSTHGTSWAVEVVDGHYRRLSGISELLSKITRELEI